MNKKEIITAFWADVAEQNEENLRKYFIPSALIYWHNTNECFTVSEYIKANCEYPGNWKGEVERIEILEGLAISVTKVWITDGSASFHATSFFEFINDKISVLNEYWGDDGIAPQWRLDKHIGKPIK